MEFLRYMSLKRFGTSDVVGIERGKCYVFPKIDGTNASVWIDESGEIQAGSRNRHLDETSNGDNAGFCKWARSQINIKSFLEENPNLRLYGEWLVPHTIKNYRQDAWKRFYVFDVFDSNTEKFIPYENYISLLSTYEIDYVPAMCTIENPTLDKLLELLPKNTFLLKDGEDVGEGIVIKNYEFVNRYGRTTWAKIVTNEFREKHYAKQEPMNIVCEVSIEEQIIENFLTENFIEKEFSKLLLELNNEGKEWTSKKIPELLGRLFYEFINEETYNFIKKHKNPIINFKTLHGLFIRKVKSTLVEVF